MTEFIRDSFINFGKASATLLRIIFFAGWFPKIEKAKQNKDCLILANGPSLNSSIENHGSFILDKILFCVNFFPSTPLYEKLKPSYHIISAPELWRSDATPAYLEHSRKLYAEIAEKTTWYLTILIPYEAKKFTAWQQNVRKNKNINIIYYNVIPVEGPRWFIHFLFKNNFGMPRPHNVLIPSLMLSINLGFKNIYIWGADHSWLPEISVDDNNRVLINQKHFYDESTSKPLPMNKLRGERKLYEVLTKFVYSFHGYFIIKEFASKQGVKILNATPKSFIDAFERYKITN